MYFLNNRYYTLLLPQTTIAAMSLLHTLALIWFLFLHNFQLAFTITSLYFKDKKVLDYLICILKI